MTGAAGAKGTEDMTDATGTKTPRDSTGATGTTSTTDTTDTTVTILPRTDTTATMDGIGNQAVVAPMQPTWIRVRGAGLPEHNKNGDATTDIAATHGSPTIEYNTKLWHWYVLL